MSNFMMHLSAIVADVSSRDELVDQLQKAVNDYKENPSEGNWKMLTVQASIVMTKQVIENKGINGFIEAADDMAKGKNIVDNIKPRN